MTNKYLPVCGLPYANSQLYAGGPYGTIPGNQMPQFSCTGTGETVCTSAFGGVITSGGGFSDIANLPRATFAPWQNTAVNDYLMYSKKVGTLPPPTYFNEAGRYRTRLRFLSLSSLLLSFFHCLFSFSFLLLIT